METKTLKDWAIKIKWLVNKQEADRKGQPYKNDEEYGLELFEIERELFKFYFQQKEQGGILSS